MRTDMSYAVQDNLWQKMTYDDWRVSLDAKAAGSWNLHATLPRDLDFFILISSISSLFGNRGQANYSAGNAFKDALAHHRIAHGQKAVSINLGLMVDEGFIAEAATVEVTLRRLQLMTELHMGEFLTLLEHYCDPALPLLSDAQAQVVFGIELPSVALAKLGGEELHHSIYRPMFSHLFAMGRRVGTSEDRSVIFRGHVSREAALKAVETEDEAGSLVTGWLQTKLAHVLGLAVEDVEPSRPAHTFGIDSLVAIDLKNWFDREVGTDMQFAAMEVVGLVAAVPGLIELTTAALRLLRGVSQSRKTLSEATNGLELQLQALSEALNLLVSRGHSGLLLSTQRQKLPPLIAQLREQLGSLNTFLSATRSDSKLKRIRIAVNNPKKRLNDEIQKLERSINILKFYLLEHNVTLNEEAAAATLAAKKSELRTLLNPSGHDFIRPKLNGTLDWVSSNTVFHQWLTASHPPSSTGTPLLPRLLLIHGPKGSGKSVLAASTATRVRSTSRPCAFFSYFHGIERQRKSETMFSTLLWQMLNFDGLSSETLGQVHNIILSSDSISLKPLLQAMECVASTLKAPFYMIVDGIDESDDDDWGDAEGPLHIFEGWMNQFANLHILLVGRQSILHHILAKYPDRSIELTEDVTRGDISMFIDYRIKESPQLNAMSEHLRAHVQEMLREKSTGMFLWVELVFKELRHCHSPSSITDCLQDLPQDLEAEYARLFTRLIHRLHSQARKPTPPVRAARTLLALVMSALEPLTIDDLRYAYAASCGKGKMWEDELITEDAVFDLIGDFVTCTGPSTQHIHICHSSLEELLLLPADKWIGKLKDVEFFRLENQECHRLMACACIEYVTNFDFGYPLAENSYHKLVGRAFLFYATKNGLPHLLYWNSVDANGSINQIELLKAYIEGSAFGGLVEFVAIASLDQVGFVDDYVSGITVYALAEFLPVTLKRIAAENAYRVDKFGPDDPRTLSWYQISSLFRVGLLMLPISSLEQPQHAQSPPPKPVTLELEEAEISDETPAVSLQILSSSGQPQSHAETASRALRREINEEIRSLGTVNAAIQSNIQGLAIGRMMQQALQIWIDPRAAFNKVAQSFVATLPIHIHLMFVDIMQMNDMDLGIPLGDLGRKRTEGQRTIYRAWALMQYLRTNDEQDERIYREVQDIIIKLEDNPITRRMLYYYVWELIDVLDSLGRHYEIPKFIDYLLNRVTDAHPRPFRHKSRRPLYSLVYKTGRWREFEVKRLGEIAGLLFNIRLFGDAERVYAHLCTCAKVHYGIHAPKTLRLQLNYVMSLLQNARFDQAEQVSSEIIMALSSNKLRELHVARYFAAFAANKLGKHSNASRILQALLQDIEPRKNESGIGVDIKNAKLAVRAKVFLLEVLGSSAHLDRNCDMRKSLLDSCLKHLERTDRTSFRIMWRGDAVWRYCVTSDEVYGQMTWQLEDSLPYGDRDRYHIPYTTRQN
ncbi:hypothetical protein O1611_g4939 [Lasiodiplodia mahajangana]|uniref:Uncharacterized protein n=1 Tax=Lasiodiplodia mahajangana TaxID=1108764 RepID=A0ACC2JMK8_9PEZI|nr:hypothetical protein O1611_g4939 [Lasiodiplodia mahajangana]